MANFSLRNTVTVHYTGSFDDGEVFDSTIGREPLTYTEGSHEVVPGFELAVASMQPGEKKTVHLEPKEAFGERKRELVRYMTTTDIPGYEELEVDSMIYIMDETGYQRLARVLQVQDDGITVFDFNHPMAGMPINFEIELISREPVERGGEADA